jgi:DNA-binding Xre family transcriptional regulator
MHESEKARLERLMSEFTQDGQTEAHNRARLSEGAGRRIGEEELLVEGGRGKRGPAHIQERVLRIRQLIRDEMAYRGITTNRLSVKTGIARPFLVRFFKNSRPSDISLSTLMRIADGLGCDVKIWFEDLEEGDTSI